MAAAGTQSPSAHAFHNTPLPLSNSFPPSLAVNFIYTIQATAAVQHAMRLTRLLAKGVVVYQCSEVYYTHIPSRTCLYTSKDIVAYVQYSFRTCFHTYWN